MIKIIMIQPYFGKWPTWFPAFLLSCAKNESISWLVFTDSEIPQVTYANVQFEQMNLRQFNDLASRKLGMPIQKTAYSQMDLRPAYGVIFDEYTAGFDFWGHHDIDVIWGNLRAFITEEILQDHNIVTCRKDLLAGHFTLWRNDPMTNTLFQAAPGFREVFLDSEHHCFDEQPMSTTLKSMMTTSEAGQTLSVHWPEQLVVGLRELAANPLGWRWENGRIFDGQNEEHVYVHFQNWKHTIQHIDFGIGDQPTSFKITSRGIWSRRRPLRELLAERYEWQGIGGVKVQLKRSLRLLKMILLVRDTFWAQKLLENSISAKDVRVARRSGRLYLKQLGIYVDKRRQDFLLEGYYWSLQLARSQQAKLCVDKQNNLVVEIAGLKIAIHSAEEIALLRELFVEGRYNMLFSRPTVVWDFDMKCGLSSIYFANRPNVVVVGFEPSKESYQQALRNIALNPSISDRIRAFNVGVRESKYKTRAAYSWNSSSRLRMTKDNSPEKELTDLELELEMEDASELLSSIVEDFPGYDIVAKIDCQGAEHQVIARLHLAGKLDLIEAIMLTWYRNKAADDPARIAAKLNNAGFRVLLFKPNDGHSGMLYGVRENGSRSCSPKQTGMLRKINTLWTQ